jgi:hypothetical protein
VIPCRIIDRKRSIRGDSDVRESEVRKARWGADGLIDPVLMPLFLVRFFAEGTIGPRCCSSRRQATGPDRPRPAGMDLSLPARVSH